MIESGRCRHLVWGQEPNSQHAAAVTHKKLHNVLRYLYTSTSGTNSLQERERNKCRHLTWGLLEPNSKTACCDTLACQMFLLQLSFFNLQFSKLCMPQLKLDNKSNQNISVTNQINANQALLFPPAPSRFLVTCYWTDLLLF